MALSEEDRLRIEEEERFRVQARLNAEAEVKAKQQQEEKRQKQVKENVKMGCLAVFVGLLFLGYLFGPKSNQSVQERRGTGTREDVPIPPPPPAGVSKAKAVISTVTKIEQALGSYGNPKFVPWDEKYPNCDAPVSVMTLLPPGADRKAIMTGFTAASRRFWITCEADRQGGISKVRVVVYAEGPQLEEQERQESAARLELSRVEAEAKNYPEDVRAIQLKSALREAMVPVVFVNWSFLAECDLVHDLIRASTESSESGERAINYLRSYGFMDVIEKVLPSSYDDLLRTGSVNVPDWKMARRSTVIGHTRVELTPPLGIVIEGE